MDLLQDTEISDKLDETTEFPELDDQSYKRGRGCCRIVADNRRQVVALSTFLFLSCGAAITHAAFVALYEILYNSDMRMQSQKMMLGLAVGLVSAAATVMFLCVLICLASCRQKGNLMRHSVLVCRIVILIEVSLAVLALSYQTTVKADAESLADWRGFISRYHKSAALRSDVDSIQTRLKCCGFSSYEDWESNAYFSCSSTTAGRCSVPASCCKGNSPSWVCSHSRIRSQTTKAKQRSELIHTRSCLDLLVGWTKYNLILLFFACLFLVCVQVMLFSVTDEFLKQAHLEETWNDNVELNLDNVELRRTIILKAESETTRGHFITLHQRCRDWKAKFLYNAMCTDVKQNVTRQGASSIQDV